MWKIRTKNIIYRFIHGQPRFGMPGGANMSLALNEPNRFLSIQFKHNIQACSISKEKIIDMQNNQWIIIEDKLPTKSPIEFQDNSNMRLLSWTHHFCILNSER